MKYQRTVEERLDQLLQVIERLIERVTDNTIDRDDLFNQLSNLHERLEQVHGLVELEDED